ncbi:MAG: hypothetical protein S0880_25075 [Actinomycetota bacterium]|nr:hypothetical protein [Actinomycetota bacterium]
MEVLDEATGTRAGVRTGWWLVGVPIGVATFLLSVAGPGGATAVAADLVRIGAVPTTATALLVAGLAGAGRLVQHLVAPGTDRGRDRSLVLLGWFVVGAATISTLLLLVAAVDALAIVPYRVLHRGLMGAGAVHLAVAALDARRSPRRVVLGPAGGLAQLTWGLLAACGAHLLCGLLTSATIHPDALQYHLAIPRSFRLADGLVVNMTLLLEGAALGLEMLYLVAVDLAAAPSDPIGVARQAVAFSLATGAVFFLGTYVVARRIGASRAAASLAMVALVTVSSIQRIGTAKNDLFAAGVALVAVALLLEATGRGDREAIVARRGERPPDDLRRAAPGEAGAEGPDRASMSDRRSTAGPYAVAGIAAGFAVAVKTTMVLPLLPFGAYLVVRGRQSPRQTVLPCTVAAAIVALPWTLRSLVLRGHPVYPFAADWPEPIAEGWEARNANGLDRTLSDLVRHWPDLVLDRYEVSGNDSMGMLFLGCFVIGAAIAVWRVRHGGSSAELVFASGALVLAAFTYETFDGRFLTRYVVYTAATTFAYVAHLAGGAVAQVGATPRSRRTIAAVVALAAIVMLAWGTDLATTARERADDPALDEIASGRIDRPALDARLAESQFSISVYRAVNNVTGDGRVLIGDQFFLFLDAEPVNAHPLHQTEISSELDAGELRRELAAREVTAAVLAAPTEAVAAFAEECGVQLAESGRVRGYAIDEPCRDGDDTD